MKNILYYIVQWTWGLIQNILGAFIYLFLILKDTNRNKESFFNAKVISWKRHGSMALGMFIFLDERLDNYKTRTLVHEYGHTIQSIILGPLYLLVIGIPSFIWANTPYFERNRRRGKYNYSYLYTEKWANYLGRKYTGLESIDNKINT